MDWASGLALGIAVASVLAGLYERHRRKRAKRKRWEICDRYHHDPMASRRIPLEWR